MKYRMCYSLEEQISYLFVEASSEEDALEALAEAVPDAEFIDLVEEYPMPIKSDAIYSELYTKTKALALKLYHTWNFETLDRLFLIGAITANEFFDVFKEGNGKEFHTTEDRDLA